MAIPSVKKASFVKADRQHYCTFFVAKCFVVKIPIGIVVVSQFSKALPPGSGHLVDGGTAVETQGLPSYTSMLGDSAGVS